ncbi:hypothetical protein [Methanobrevibacter millerae]|nr:hypothetical protein [Methanobrevibacter millerae]
MVLMKGHIQYHTVNSSIGFQRLLKSNSKHCNFINSQQLNAEI